MKKRISKLVSLLVAAVMLVGMLTVNVAAADKGIIDELYDDYGTGSTVEYSTAKAYDGKRSIHIKAGTDNDRAYLGQKSDLGITRSNSYDVTFYVYPVSTAGDMWVSIDGGVRGYLVYDGTTLKDNRSIFTMEKLTDPSKAGWWKASATNKTAEGTWDPQLFIAEGGFECYIDMLTVKDTTEAAPSFSSSFEKAVTPDARVDYMPKNLMVTQVSSTELSVSWRNPAAPAISSIKLYDGDGTELVPTTAFSTAADAKIEYIDTAFTANTEKLYKVEFTYGDNTVKSFVTGFMPTGSGYDYEIGNWKLVSGSSPKPPAKLTLDNNVYRTAAPSIKVVSNFTGGSNDHSKQQWLAVYADEALDTTATYRVTGYAKMNNTAYIWERLLDDQNGSNRIYTLHGKYNEYKSLTNWTKFTFEGKPTSANTKIINFNIEGSIEDLWIDDVSLYKLDADKNPTGDDLLASIGSADNFATTPEITLGTCQSKTNAARLRWTAGTEHKYVAVYDTEMSEYTPVAYVPASLGYVDLENLAGGTTYTYILKGVDANGRESAAGVTATVTPEAEALVINDYVTSKSGNNVTVSVDIKNNSASSDVTAQLLLAVYEGDVLQSLETTAATAVPQTAIGAAATTLSQTVAVPDGQTLIIYLWNSLDGMAPLKKCVTYTAE